MRNNPNLDLVNINAYAKFGQIPSICSRSRDITLLYKLMRNNPNLDLAKFGQIPSICSQDMSGNKILTAIKGHNSAINLQKLTQNNPT